MSIAVQKSFFGADKYIADARQKLAELYFNNPEIAQSEKRCLLEFWSTYEDLSQLLGDKWEQFTEWFMKATSPETITRCLRSLREDGTVKLNKEQQEQRQEVSNTWREYWARKRKGNGYGESAT